jgi:hypothetical protein
LKHFKTQKKPENTGSAPTYQLKIRDPPTDAQREAKAAKKERQRQRREALYKSIREM